MSLRIIKADVSHAAAIGTIGKKAFRKSFEHLFHSREELFEYLEFTYDPVKLGRSLRKENNIYLLAFVDNIPAGFAKIKKSSLNEQIATVAQMELQKIYVLPDYNGRGIGSALMNEIKRIADEIQPDYIWLDTHISNVSAVRFYERNGFQKIGDYFFTIGTQTFQYYLMGLPIAKIQPATAK